MDNTHDDDRTAELKALIAVTERCAAFDHIIHSADECVAHCRIKRSKSAARAISLLYCTSAVSIIAIRQHTSAAIVEAVCPLLSCRGTSRKSTRCDRRNDGIAILMNALSQQTHSASAVKSLCQTLCLLPADAAFTAAHVTVVVDACPSVESVQRAAAGLVGLLMENNDLHTPFVHVGGVELLLQSIKDFASTANPFGVVALFRLTSASPSIVRRVVELGDIECVVSIVSDGHHSKAFCRARCFYSNVCTVPVRAVDELIFFAPRLIRSGAFPFADVDFKPNIDILPEMLDYIEHFINDGARRVYVTRATVPIETSGAHHHFVSSLLTFYLNSNGHIIKQPLKGSTQICRSDVLLTKGQR